MQIAKCRMQKEGRLSILHFAFCILHFLKWCERGDSNPHGFGPLDPKSSASTNSATLAPHVRVSQNRWCPHQDSNLEPTD